MTTDELRFYLDENVSNEIAEALHVRGVDVLTTPEALHMGNADTDQLSFAISEGRVLVTQDRDFLRMARQEIEHKGIVYWRPQSRNVKYVIRELLRLHRDMTPEKMVNNIEFL